MFFYMLCANLHILLHYTPHTEKIKINVYNMGCRLGLCNSDGGGACSRRKSAKKHLDVFVVVVSVRERCIQWLALP